MPILSTRQMMGSLPPAGIPWCSETSSSRRLCHDACTARTWTMEAATDVALDGLIVAQVGGRGHGERSNNNKPAPLVLHRIFLLR